MKTIVQLSPSKHIKGRILAYFSDGTLLKVTEQEVVAFGLHTGLSLEDDALRHLSDAGAQSSAKALAAKIVSQRPLSTRQLLEKLLEKDVAPADAEHAVTWLTELGAVNDQHYASMLVRHYAAKGYGKRRIAQEFYKRKVDRSCWDAALSELEPSDHVLDSLIERKLRGQAPDEGSLRRLIGFLQRRGYQWDEIRSALNRQNLEGTSF